MFLANRNQYKNPWTCKPVYIARKKQVNTAYTPNSNRIFQDEISDENEFVTRDNSKFKRCSTASTLQPAATRNIEQDTINQLGYFGRFPHLKAYPGYIDEHPKEPTRRNCPHPQSARFLRSNVKDLNYAIPFIATDNVDNTQNTWWCHPDDDDDKKFHRTVSCINSKNDETKRQFKLPKLKKASRPPTSPWILNHIALNQGRKNTVESISYRHGYNCRNERTEPIRGKLAGSFVWNDTDKPQRLASSSNTD